MCGIWGSGGFASKETSEVLFPLCLPPAFIAAGMTTECSLLRRSLLKLWWTAVGLSWIPRIASPCTLPSSTTSRGMN